MSACFLHAFVVCIVKVLKYQISGWILASSASIVEPAGSWTFAKTASSVRSCSHWQHVTTKGSAPGDGRTGTPEPQPSVWVGLLGLSLVLRKANPSRELRFFGGLLKLVSRSWRPLKGWMFVMHFKVGTDSKCFWLFLLRLCGKETMGETVERGLRQAR